MSAQTWQETLMSTTAVGAAFASFTTAKTVLPPGCLVTLPPNWWYVGRMLRVTAHVAISNKTTQDTMNFSRNQHQGRLRRRHRGTSQPHHDGAHDHSGDAFVPDDLYQRRHVYERHAEVHVDRGGEYVCGRGRCCRLRGWNRRCLQQRHPRERDRLRQHGLADHRLLRGHFHELVLQQCLHSSIRRGVAQLTQY